MKAAMWFTLAVVSAVVCVSTGGAASLALLVLYGIVMSHRTS